MPGLDERIRRLHDSVPPVTLDEVRGRPSPPSLRPPRRTTVRWVGAGAAAALVAAAVVTAVTLAGQGPTRVTVSGSSTPVVARITVAHDSVTPGRSFAATLTLTDNTGRSLQLPVCREPLDLRVSAAPDGPPIPVLQPAPPCTNRVVLHPGVNRFRASVPTTRLSDGSLLLKGEYPDGSIPVGRYWLRADLTGLLPAGSRFPAPVAVAVVPDPVDGRTFNPANLPLGKGALEGRLGPGPPGSTGPVPDIALTFISGTQEVTTTAIGGVYEVFLAPGTWSVHGSGVCDTGLTVGAAAWQRDDLMWPLQGCQDLSGPPAGRGGPTGEVPPPSGGA